MHSTVLVEFMAVKHTEVATYDNAQDIVECSYYGMAEVASLCSWAIKLFESSLGSFEVRMLQAK